MLGRRIRIRSQIESISWFIMICSIYVGTRIRIRSKSGSISWFIMICSIYVGRRIRIRSQMESVSWFIMICSIYVGRRIWIQSQIESVSWFISICSVYVVRERFGSSSKWNRILNTVWVYCIYLQILHQRLSCHYYTVHYTIQGAYFKFSNSMLCIPPNSSQN